MSAQAECSESEVLSNSSGQAAGLASHLPPRLLSLGLAILIFLPGCSWIFVKPARVDDHPNPACSSSRAAPVLDTIQAVGNVIGVAALATMDDFENRNALIVSWILWAGIYTASAAYGYSNTSECVEGRSESYDRPELLDPDYRPPPKKKKRSGPLVPEPGVMRSN